MFVRLPKMYGWSTGLQWALAISPFLVAVAYLVVLIPQFSGFFTSVITWNSDATAYMLLSQTIAQHGIQGPIYLSNATWYSRMLLDVATFHLPDYQLIWEVWPPLAYLLAACALGWSISRICTPLVGVLCGLCAGVMTAPTLFPVLGQAYHGLSTATAALLAVFFVLLVRADGHLSWRLLVVVCALTLMTGVNAASDPLLLVIGIVPLVFASIMWVVFLRDGAAIRVSAICVALCLASLVVMQITARAGASLHFVYRSPFFHLVPLSQVPTQLTFAGGILYVTLLGNWTYFSNATPGRAEFCFALGVLLLLTTLFVWTLWRMLRAQKSTPRDRAELAHVLIWAVIGLAILGALSVTPWAINLIAARYATILPLVAAALLMLAAPRTTRHVPWVVASLVTLVLLIRTILWIPFPLPTAAIAHPNEMPAIVAYLQAQHIRYGYADYWQADAITWVTNGAVTLRPASSCADPGPLCGLAWSSATGWYRPYTGRLAVVVNPMFRLNGVPTAYGKPVAVQRFGSMTVYIYNRHVPALPERP